MPLPPRSTSNARFPKPTPTATIESEHLQQVELTQAETMAKGKRKNNNKPDKPARRGPNQPPKRLTKLPRRSPHRDAALSTFELLEAILLHVDMRTLVVSAQRVCTRWHAVISNSTPLQRHLFFAPIPRDPIAAGQGGDNDNGTNTAHPYPSKAPFIQNPLLKRAFPCLFELTAPADDTSSENNNHHTTTTTTTATVISPRPASPGRSTMASFPRARASSWHTPAAPHTRPSSCP